jgi:hypothetical protein
MQPEERVSQSVSRVILRMLALVFLFFFCLFFFTGNPSKARRSRLDLSRLLCSKVVGGGEAP